jgi:hypothetical protein
MADTDLTQTAAKGLYTFTTFEKIEMRYGVIAASWDEAKDHMENYNFIKLNNGDHYGGNYIGESEPRRAKLNRKQTCMGANFTMTKTVKSRGFITAKAEEGTVMFANVDHSQAIYIPEFDAYDLHQYDGEGNQLKILSIEDNGCCLKCNRMMRDGWSMIPKREATHTTWERELKTAPCGTKYVDLDPKDKEQQTFDHPESAGEE